MSTSRDTGDWSLGSSQQPYDAAPSHGESWRAVSAAIVGNILEWYDFAIYGYVATIIAHNFFPSGDQVGALLATFATFGIGFVARPLGGIIIGRMGDTRGRKAALLLTIFLMAIGTVGIGLIPSYNSIGVLAPLLLVICRLMQGFAAGGEWGGATAFIVEWAPEKRRGFFGSFQQASVAGGLLLGSAIAALCSTLLSADQMEAWGWRIPFLLGIILVPVGIYMRSDIKETPAYRQSEEEASPSTQRPAGCWRPRPSASPSSGRSPTISSSITCRHLRRNMPG